MITELNLAGVFMSPLVLCITIAFAARLGISWVLQKTGFYEWVWQRPLFDTALFLVLTGLVFSLGFGPLIH